MNAGRSSTATLLWAQEPRDHHRLKTESISSEPTFDNNFKFIKLTNLTRLDSIDHIWKSVRLIMT